MLEQDFVLHYHVRMKTGENYGKFLDMLDLALMMQEKPFGLTISEIMSRFDVSRRTAERMRDALANYFGPDFSEERHGAQKRFMLRSRRLDALVAFSREELAVFGLAAKTLRQSGLEDSAAALDSAFSKLKSLLKLKAAVTIDVEDMMRIEGLVLRPGPKIRHDETLLETLREAMLSFHQVGIDYAKPGKMNRHILIPLGFLYGERNHYLTARYVDDPDKKPIHFILDLIRRVDILPDTFEEDEKFSLEAHAAGSFGAFHEEPFPVEWLFSPEVAEDAARYIFHPSQSTQRNADGSLTVRFKAGGRLEMAWHLYTWGEHVRVIEPADFWHTLPKI